MDASWPRFQAADGGGGSAADCRSGAGTRLATRGATHAAELACSHARPGVYVCL